MKSPEVLNPLYGDLIIHILCVHKGFPQLRICLICDYVYFCIKKKFFLKKVHFFACQLLPHLSADFYVN